MLYKLAFVKASTHRTNIVNSLHRCNKTPKDLSMEFSVHQNTISGTLRQLRDQKIVEVINPEAKKGRIYKLTDIGLEIAKELK